MDVVKSAVLVALAGIIGFVAWGASVECLALAAVYPLLWRLSPSRWTAAGVGLAYYGAAARGLPAGVAVFWGHSDMLVGLALWAVATALLTLPWFVLWTRQRGGGWAWRCALALLLTAIPPIGWVGWAHPVTAAGVYLPGTGTAGLLLFLVALTALVVVPRPWAAGAALIALVTSAAVAGDSLATGWRGHDTQYGELSSARIDPMGAYRRIRELRRVIGAVPPGAVAVLPETIVGQWTGATGELLAAADASLKARGSTVILGAEVHDATGYDNVALAIGADAGVVYRQQQPVPISMWAPWRERSARAHGPGQVATIGGRRVAVAICYEQLLVWPVALALAADAEILVGMANDWWARETSIPAIQRTALSAWGRLYGVPVVTAVNL